LVLNFEKFQKLLDPNDVSDYDLGRRLLASWIGAQAESQGIPANKIPPPFAEKMREAASLAETDFAVNSAIEKALQKAAIGDFEVAGRFLREHLVREAGILKSDAEIKRLEPFAATGEKFRQGRKVGTGGPIRKVIAELLAKEPTLSNAQLWDAIRKKPPKGWKSQDNVKFGKYFEGPENKNMGYSRFLNVCAEERKKFTKAKKSRDSEPVK
jgi:hypothetical protein